VLIGSDLRSLTSNTPGLVDLLVTFIACEIVTGRGLTEILGSHPGRFCGRTAAVARPAVSPDFHAAMRQSRGAPFALAGFPTNMPHQPARRPGVGDSDGDREMHQRV
jgi:hypothetical protein